MNKASQLPRIDSVKPFAEASSILRTLEDGQRNIERSIDSLKIEGYLERRPKDSRAPLLRERLAENRKTSSNAIGSKKSDLAPAVTAALELIRNGSRSNTRASRESQIQQLEADRKLVHDAVIEQSTIVESLKSELSEQVARRMRDEHRALVLQQFRALQQVAAATDAERQFRSAVLEAGYAWRADLLPAPLLRSALALGLETEGNSEITRTRLLLESWGLLK
jgi:hypothetical protein